MDKKVPIDTVPSLPSFIILKKHFRFSEFNTLGQISMIPIEKPVKRHNPYISKFKINFFLYIKYLYLINKHELSKIANEIYSWKFYPYKIY